MSSKKKSSKKSSRKSDRYDRETSEERRERKERKKSRKLTRSFGYSNESNPFGDANLTSRFVWTKKINESKKRKSASSSSSRGFPDVDKREELIDEIRKVRRRRDERDAEKEEMERLRNEELRLKDAAQYEDWQRKEEEFHLNQAKLRCLNRIVDRREEALDQLAKGILLFENNLWFTSEEKNRSKIDNHFKVGLRRAMTSELTNPVELLMGLSAKTVDDTLENLQVLIDGENESSVLTSEYWKCLDRILRDRVEAASAERAIHSSVNAEIKAMFKDQTLDGLLEMEEDIEHTLEDGRHSSDSAIDVDYWESVLKQLQVAKAVARLNQIHQQLLKRQLEYIRQRQQYLKDHPEERLEEQRTAAASSRTSPSRSHQESSTRVEVDNSREARAMEREAQEQGLEEEEEEFGAKEEVELPDTGNQMYQWPEQYRPRKPRYFNRVKTGFDWNKYNQTHFDQDNPPPKIVQGYKFNLFYPDLVDKSITPKFTLERVADSSDFCILRFSAGPPYQDIAFKIVNREWEYSRRHGFKSVFERGILHLYFNFKRIRYRR